MICAAALLYIISTLRPSNLAAATQHPFSGYLFAALISPSPSLTPQKSRTPSKLFLAFSRSRATRKAEARSGGGLAERRRTGGLEKRQMQSSSSARRATSPASLDLELAGHDV